MKVIKLFEQGSNIPSLFKCGNCGSVYIDEQIAQQCCEPVICTKCGKQICQDKTKTREFYFVNPIMCCECKQQEKINNMEEWTEQQYLENTKKHDSKYASAVVCGDDYYDDLYDCLESLNSDGYGIDDIKQINIFATYEMNLEKLNIYNALENIYENTGLDDVEDMNVIFKDLDELYKFIEEWNKKQTYTYFQQAPIKIRVDDKTIEEYWKEE